MNKHCNAYFLIAILTVAVLPLTAQASMKGHAAMVERARACGVSSDTIDRVGGAMLAGSLTNTQGEQLLTTLIQVCDAGLPLPPFEAKLIEGLGKGIPSQRITAVLNRQIDTYLFARSLLPDKGVKEGQALLEAMGEGMTKGVPRETFSDYIATYGTQADEALLTGAEMTSLLCQAGFDYATIKPLLDAGFTAGSLSPQWRYFIRIALVARTRGVDNMAIVRAATDVLVSKGVPSDVSARLGFTSRDMTRTK